MEDSFHVYVKPDTNKKLSFFCKQLTGIQQVIHLKFAKSSLNLIQEWVDNGKPLKQVLSDYEVWLNNKGLFANKLSFTFVTCGGMINCH